MTTLDAHVQRLRQRLKDARRENRRFRERIELLASQNHHLRASVKEAVGAKPEIRSFERIESPIGPRKPTAFEPRSLKKSQKSDWYSASWFPTFENGIAPLDPSPGLRCLTAVRAPIRMGFLLFDMDGRTMEETVSTVEERQLRERDFIPVFVTDNCDFGVFRSRGYVFEYIPPSIANASSNQRTKRRILKDRLELIMAKWNLSDIVDLSG